MLSSGRLSMPKANGAETAKNLLKGKELQCECGEWLRKRATAADNNIEGHQAEHSVLHIRNWLGMLLSCRGQNTAGERRTAAAQDEERQGRWDGTKSTQSKYRKARDQPRQWHTCRGIWWTHIQGYSPEDPLTQDLTCCITRSQTLDKQQV